MHLLPFPAAAVIVLLFSPVAASAQAGADPCPDARTQTEMNLCAARELRTADAELNRVYQQLTGALEPDLRASLRTAQRAWIAFRDADCRSEAAEYEGGSMQPMVLSSCLADRTRDRTAQLRQRARRLREQ
jgi:uncharacterized protein YecT (DUF1311 family)